LEAAAKAGYSSRKIFGGFMLIRPDQDASEAIHMIFTGEKPKSHARFQIRIFTRKKNICRILASPFPLRRFKI
jgi:hypothetical protein